MTRLNPGHLNLAVDPWLPVCRKDGTFQTIAPWQIVENHEQNPVIAVNGCREPWEGALTEFLVALVQTALFPTDAREWRERWDAPPEPERLHLELEKIAKYFDLAGEHPFMQDASLRSEKKLQHKPVERLLVGGVSERQIENTSDIFTKRGTVQRLCAACAATALWDLQSHAPQGGRGYFTSLRGGGPVTTLIACDTLWKTVWANVVEQAALSMKGRPDPATFLPWVSQATGKVDAADESPLHVYWGMPRRVLLEWAEGEATCDSCGETAASTTTSFLTMPGGRQYVEGDWRHPLSPYTTTKTGWCVRGTTSDLMGYRQWMGIIVDTPQGDGVPAFVVRRWLERAALGEPKLRVWGFGYRTQQASILSWCEGTVPVPVLANGRREAYASFMRTLVALAQYGVEQLGRAVWGLRTSTNRPGIDMQPLQGAFWRDTAPLFEEAIHRAAADPSSETLNRETDAWIGTVRLRALALYDRYAKGDGAAPEWVARYAHRLRRVLGFRCPTVLKTSRYGDWRLEGF